MRFANPVISTNNHRMTSGFGMRDDPLRPGTQRMHWGADFTDGGRLELTAAGVGVIAIADGTVAQVFFNNSTGWTVAIMHAGGIVSQYQHLRANSVAVRSGEAVKKGQRLGIMGTTGASTGVHLHLGIREGASAWNGGRWGDPEPYLRGEKTIGGSDMNVKDSFNVVVSTAAIELNGEPLILRDFEGNALEVLNISGTLYAPVSPMARAFGKRAEWDGGANTLRIWEV